MVRHQPNLRFGCATVVALCLLCEAEALRAQAAGERGAGALTLQQVMGEAQQKYPAIRAAKAQEKAAQAAVGVARSAFLPRTDVLWQTNRATANNVYGLLLPQSVIPTISGPVIGSDVGRSAWSSGGGVLFSWQPIDFGAREARVRAAQQGSEAGHEAEALAELQTTTGVASAFFDLAAAQQLVKVATANVKRNESFDMAVHVLVENTLRPGADASQAEAQLALARNQLIQAETQVEVRRASLAKFLLRSGEGVVIAEEELLKSVPAGDVGVAKAAEHPAVRQEEALIRQGRAEERALERSYAPQLSTLAAASGRGAGTSLDGNFPGGSAGLAPSTFNWAAGVQITFSALDVFSLREQEKVQRARVQAAEARHDQAVQEVDAEMAQARATLAGARQIAANTPVELSAAQTSEQQQQARYRSGLATVVDVAAAEGVLAQAQADDAIARLSVWRAELGVAAAVGDLRPFLQLLESAEGAK